MGGKKRSGHISRRDFLSGVVGGSVATFLLPGVSTGRPRGKGCVGRKVYFGSQSLAVLRSADVVIAGGSFAAVAAALEFRKAGKSVVVVESRTYPGREVTAHLRPWFEAGKLRKKEQFAEPVRSCLGAMGVGKISGEIPVKLDTVKLTLEELLIDSGVELIYASHPVSVLTESGAVRGIVIGNKSGRQVIKGDVVIDATETAAVARCAGAEFEPAGEKRFNFRRTIEYDDVKPLSKTTLRVSNEVGITGDKVKVHKGYRGEGHVYLEFGPVLKYGKDDLQGCMEREIEARHRSIKLAGYLANNYEEFRDSYMAATSYELWGRHTSRMSGEGPKWALPFGDFTVTFSDLKERRFSTASFATGVVNLWCLQEGARVEDGEIFLEPVSASFVGAGFARSLLRRWKDSKESYCSGRHTKGFADSKKASGGMEVRCPESPQRGRWYDRMTVGPLEVPIAAEADVLVVGGGTSGATAAITSAREGASTVLIELNPGLGGTGTIGGVNSYWFGRHVGFCAHNKELVQEANKLIHHRESMWNKEIKGWRSEDKRAELYGDLWNSEVKMYALVREAERVGVEIFWNAVTIGTVMEGNRVCGVVAAGRYGVFAVLGKVVIDGTGDGDVAVFGGGEYTYGSRRDNTVMWYSLAQIAKPGRTHNNFTSMVDVSNIEDYTRAVIVGRRRGDCHDHGIYIASRQTRQIVGDVVLTLTEQMRQKKWADAVNIHYSNYDIKGKSTTDWIRMGLLPANLEVEIPYRALLPRGLENILVVGKAISTTRDGLPGLRMQADMENLGGAAALAACEALKEGVGPREIKISKLQERIVDAGLLPKEFLTREVSQNSYTDTELEEMVGSLSGEEPLYSYCLMEMGEVLRERIAIVEVCTAGCRAESILEEAISGAEGERRLRLAQALAMYGNGAGVDALTAEIERQLGGGELPGRSSKLPYTQLPPDQGAMPDVVYLMYSLGMTGDARGLKVWRKVAELLRPTEKDFWDSRKCIFDYVDAVCYGTELLGDAAAIPVLQKIHNHECLRDLVVRDEFNPDYVHERRAMLELYIGRALARCGSGEGVGILISYLDDNRAILAEGAHKELVSITGRDYGKDRGAWGMWLAKYGGAFSPCRLVRRLEG